MTNLEVSKAELILHNVITLYREEAVERVHILPIAPRQLPWLRRTVNGGKNVFIKNMNNVVVYYQTAVKRLESSRHTKEAKDLEDRRLRLKAMIDGLNFNMIAVFTFMDQRLGTLDEDARYAVIGRFPAFEATMAEQLPAASATQDQKPDATPFVPQYPPIPSSTAETPIAEYSDEPDSRTGEDLDHQVQNNIEVSPALQAMEDTRKDEAEKTQSSQDNSEQVISPLDENSHDNCADNNESAMTGEAGDHELAAPLIFAESSVVNTLVPTPESTTSIPEQPEPSNSINIDTAGSQRPALKRSFDEMENQESEGETMDNEVEYEEVTDDEDEVIIITEEPEEEALLPLPETTTLCDQTPQESKEVDLSCQPAQKEESEDDNIEHEQVADEEEEPIIITEEPEEEESPLPGPEIPTLHEQAAQESNGSESPSSAMQEESTGAEINECLSLPILPESEFTNEGTLQHFAMKDSRQGLEETTDSNDDFLSQVETPAQPQDAPESISSISPVGEHSNKTVPDYLNEGSSNEWGSSLSQEDQDFLHDFYAAEEFLASSSDEDGDAYPVKVIVVPVNATVENTHHTETISGQESVLSQAAEEAPSSEESTLLNEDEVLEEKKTETKAATNENEESNAVVGASKENTETAAPATDTAEVAEVAETVPAVDEKLESGDETEDKPDTTPAPVPTQESEGAIDSYEPPQWSLRGILGTVIAVGVPMAIIYPTSTAVVLFGMIRYARSRR
jgi:hypothetical protein